MRGRVSIDTGRSNLISVEKRATDLVAKAAAVRFPVDPLFGEDLSRSFSVVNSVVRRHGLEIQGEIARALKATGSFEVFANITLPVTASGGGLARRLCVDLLVINIQEKWIGAYEVKRGLGSTESARRRLLETDLLNLRDGLPAIAADLGYGDIEHATSAIISYFDVASFKHELILRRADLDSHFDAPVTAAVDALTRAIGDALQATLPALFGLRSSADDKLSRGASARVARPFGPADARRFNERKLGRHTGESGLRLLRKDKP